MGKEQTSLYQHIGLCLIASTIVEGLAIAPHSIATAQTVVSDFTIGTEVEVSDGAYQSILGGTLSGDNLFHSFDTFSTEGSLPTYFWLNHPSYNGLANNVTDIFSRVTGSEVSSLNGYLSILGGNSPNLFLLNSNGILLGPEAVLDIPGSLFLSTADSILFEEAQHFAISDTTVDSLLTVSAPVGIQFGERAAPIEVDGSYFGDTTQGNYFHSFFPEKSVTLLGGDISVNNTYIFASSGQVQLGSVAENTQVSLEGDRHTLTYAPNTDFQDIELNDSVVDVRSFFDGNNYLGSGRSQLQGRHINVNSTTLRSDNIGEANGRPIEIDASQQLTLTNSTISATLSDGVTRPDSQSPFVPTATTGRGGDILISARDFIVEAVTSITASNLSRGIGGDITIEADSLSLTGSADRTINGSGLYSINIATNNFNTGNGGHIFITADDFSAVGDVSISTTASSAPSITYPENIQFGNSGNVTLTARNFRLRNGVQIGAGTFTNGNAGNLTIRADQVSLQEQLNPALQNSGTALLLSTSTYDEGTGGDLLIEANAFETNGPLQIFAASIPSSLSSDRDYGNGGSLTIDAGSINLRNGALISSATYSGGDAGLLNIIADDISLVGTTTNIDSSSGEIETTGLSVILTADTYGSGQGGDFSIMAETLNATGEADILSSARPDFFTDTPADSDGNGGNLTVEVGHLNLLQGSQIGTNTSSGGSAGNLMVRASNSIDIEGLRLSETVETGGGVHFSRLSSTVQKDATGNGGTLTVATPALRIREGGKVSADTRGYGNAGNVTIRANDISVADAYVDELGAPTGITATAAPGSIGEGGRIDIVSDRIHLFNGGQVSAVTAGSGSAGDINILSNVVDVEGTDTTGLLFTSISSFSGTDADAGSIMIAGHGENSRLSVRDRASISVSNIANGVAGNLNIQTGTIELNNGRIDAEAGEGSQGNITLASENVLLLRDRSTLTTNARNTATGGNINISAPIIIGLENSDITANAEAGDGGNIQLVTNGLVGLAFRDRLTPDNDITASSEQGTNGTVEISSPKVDPDSGLVNLPTNLVDISEQIAPSCGANQSNQFVSTGRAGLPDSPYQLMPIAGTLQDLGADTASSELEELTFLLTVQNHESAKDVMDARQTPPNDAELQEAAQWQVNAKGEVELVAATDVEASLSDCLTQNIAFVQ